MFERFTQGARQTVVLAQQDARSRRHGFIGTEHMLMGLFGVPDGVAAQLLAELGVTAGDIDAELSRIAGPPTSHSPSDAAALASIGIDIEEVRRQIEEAFGPGALDRTRDRRRRWGRPGRVAYGPGRVPFTRNAKKALELALRHAVALHHGYIGTEHILLGLLSTGEGLAGEMLEARGVDTKTVRAAIVDRDQGAAGA